MRDEMIPGFTFFNHGAFRAKQPAVSKKSVDHESKARPL